jgi:hypothetical protein
MVIQAVPSDKEAIMKPETLDTKLFVSPIAREVVAPNIRRALASTKIVGKSLCQLVPVRWSSDGAESKSVLCNSAELL